MLIEFDGAFDLAAGDAVVLDFDTGGGGEGEDPPPGGTTPNRRKRRGRRYVGSRVN